MATAPPLLLPPPSPSSSPVFVDSSLGTHLGMTVYPADTVADFKRKIAIEHALCFPRMGKINVQALKVKRRGALYHLSDTMLVMLAFHGNKGTWFLHVDITGSSISKHQGGTARHFLNDSREYQDEDDQLILKPMLNVEENLQLNRNNISIDGGSNLHEKTDHISLAKEPTPGSCQFENLVDAAIVQLASSNHNDDEGTHDPIEEHTEVFNNGGSLGDKETSNLENVLGEVHPARNMDGLLNPEEYASKLPAGDSSLIEHHTDDTNKKKKKKGSRSSKSQQTEVDSVMPLKNHHTVLSPTSEEQNIEHGRSLEKNDVLGYVPAVMEGNNEAPVNNQEYPIRKIDDETNQTSENIADEDSSGFDNTRKNDVPGFSSENMAKGSYSTHLSGTVDPSKAAEAGTSEVALNCNPDAVIIGPEDEPITKEAVPLAEVNSQIPTNIHSKKISSKRLSKNTLSSKEPTHSIELANEENLNELLESDHKDTETNKEAPSHGDIAKLDTERPSADGIKRSHHKTRRKSEKTAFAAFQPNNHEPVQSLQNLTDQENLQEKLDDSKQQELVVTTEVDVLAESAAHDSVFPPKPDDTRTKKEASSCKDIAELETENPSADNVGRSHHKKRRKSSKAGSAKFQHNSHEDTGFAEIHPNNPEEVGSAEFQPNNHEPVRSLQKFVSEQNLQEKLDEQNLQELVAATEAKVHANCEALNSGFPPKLDAKSRQKRKKSSKIELEVHETTRQDLSHSLVTEVAVRAKETMDDHHNEQSGQSELLDNHGEAIIEGSANVNLVVSSGTNDKSRHHRKRKSAKSDLSYSTQDNHGLIYSSECQIKEKFEKASTTTNDPVGVSNDDALLKECEQSAFLENEPKKQHKSRKKIKSSKHDTTHDLVDPSESDKKTLAISEDNRNDPGNQDSVDPIVKPSSRGSNNSKAQYSVNDGGNFSDWMSSQNSHGGSHKRAREKIQGNKPDTSLQVSVSQDEQSKQIYHSKEKTFLKAATKSPDLHVANSPNYLKDETVQVKKNKIVNVKAHSIQSQSMAIGDDSHHKSLPNAAASSDSTQENRPVQANKYKLAVRKVPNKGLGKKSDSYKPNIPFVTPGTIFDDASSGSSEGEFELKDGDDTKTAALESPLSDSDEEGSKRSAEERIDGKVLTQSAMSSRKKGMPLSAILRSTSSYKKSKVQAQADSESQPVDVVPETQPEY